MSTLTAGGYSFVVYDLSGVRDGSITLPAVGAVYLFTRDNSILYVGETEDLSERNFKYHHKLDCVDSYRGNSLCIHQDGSQASRLYKESRLIQQYSPPCNG